MIEKWKDVLAYEGLYQVSNKGRVKSLARKQFNTSKTGGKNWTSHYPPVILKHGLTTKGYPIVALHKDGRQRTKTVHRLMAQVFLDDYSETLFVDHKDTVRTNNLIGNLRMATFEQNGANSTKQKGCSSKFKGVCYDKSRSKWQAQMKLNYKVIHLGRYDNEEEAARAYDVALVEHYGEFALTNEMMGLYKEACNEDSI